MGSYKLSGTITQILFPTWPLGISEEILLKIGDLVEVNLEHTPPTHTIASGNDAVTCKIYIRGLTWDLGSIMSLSSDPTSCMTGIFPDVDIFKQGFTNPWEGSQLEFSQNDQSSIALYLKANSISSGNIECIGEIQNKDCVFNIVFSLEPVLNTPTIGSITSI